MELPQIIWIFLSGGALFVALVKNGESRGNYSFFGTLISLAIEFWILIAGGFFK